MPILIKIYRHYPDSVIFIIVTKIKVTLKINDKIDKNKYINSLKFEKCMIWHLISVFIAQSGSIKSGNSIGKVRGRKRFNESC